MEFPWQNRLSQPFTEKITNNIYLHYLHTKNTYKYEFIYIGEYKNNWN